MHTMSVAPLASMFAYNMLRSGLQYGAERWEEGFAVVGAS